MEIQSYIQPILTLISSTAIVVILRQQIKSQQEQITSMKSSMDAMKAYMDIFKIDEVKKYVSVMEETAINKGQNAAEKVIKETLKSDEWAKNLFKPFEEKLEKIFEKDLYQKGQELFHNTIDHLSCLPKEEMEAVVKEQYPINGVAILQEFEDIQKNDPDFLKERRESYLESLPESLRTETEQNQILNENH